MDALSHVLSAIRLTGCVFLEAELREGCSYLTLPPSKIGALLMPEAEHIIPYHLVTAGSGHARLLDGEEVDLQVGDLIVFAHGDRHVLAGPGEGEFTPVQMSEEDLHSLLRPGRVTSLQSGSHRDTMRVVCGYLACDRRLSERVLTGLPRLLRINFDDNSIADWVRSSIRFLVTERSTPRAGSMTMLAKLSELLFIEAIRHYIETLPSEQIGWFAALRDRFVGRALGLFHAEPSYPWTVDELAKQVGLSRSALADRFGEVLRQPPMQYLTQWRLSLAAQHLLTDSRGLAQIAQEVGYDSEAAFNRAFKRTFGVPPATWRKTKGSVSQESDIALVL